MVSAAFNGSMVSGASRSHNGVEKTNESLPELILANFDACAVQEVVKKLAKHYGVPAAFLALESPEDLKLKACYGISLRSVGHNSIAKHGIARDLPIIIEDVKAESRFTRDPLVVGQPFGFFAGSPLMMSSRRCVGSLCIMDHACRAFTLQDAAFLDECARAICEIYKPSVNAQDLLWKYTVDSLVSIDSADLFEGAEDEEEEEEEEWMPRACIDLGELTRVARGVGIGAAFQPWDEP